MRFALALSVFAVGLSSKLWLILKCGSSVPYWDQWELLPLLKGGWSGLFATHNEHRIVFTKLWTVLLFNLN